ncbi:MAG: CoA transferase [Chloroflexota bacterium]|nr:CoA transferase [Chloroflexota bacterium]
MPRPLEGIRVVECAQFHAGPGAGAILGDLGAEVIKVEDKTGDPERGWIKVGDFPMNFSNGTSVIFQISNRNKKGIVLDLRKKRGRDVLLRMLEKSDVFITNFRKNSIEKLDLGYDALSKINPMLIYAAISGYGREGPDSDMPAFDAHGQGRSGMMIAQGGNDNPVLLRLGVVDQATAIAASHQIITALLVRERYGIGQELDVSLLSASMWLLQLNLATAFTLGREMPFHDRRRASPLRNYFRCSDGKWLIGSHNPPDMYWRPLCMAVGAPELADSPQFDTEDKRWQNGVELTETFDGIFAEKTCNEWLDILKDKGLVFAPVQSCLDLPNDPQVEMNGYVDEYDHPVLGRVKLPAYPCHFSRTPAQGTKAAPGLGEHTDEVLQEVAGYSPGAIKKLRAEGII